MCPNVINYDYITSVLTLVIELKLYIQVSCLIFYNIEQNICFGNYDKLINKLFFLYCMSNQEFLQIGQK